MENNFLNYKPLKSIKFNQFNLKIKIYKIGLLSVFIIIIILLIIIKILYSNLKRTLFILKLFKEFKNEDDVKLYMKNKTEYYFKYRMKFLKINNIKYNETNLVTFQDKLNYLVIHENPELKTEYVDKIKIHEATKKIIGKDICVPILKIYNDANEINLDELPNKFLLKLNHGSGMNIICKNKSNFNLNDAKMKLNNWKQKNYGLDGTEFQYMFVDRKIFAAPYLGDNIVDYEIFCFNGIPKLIRVQKTIFEHNNTIIHNYYDLNWTLTEIDTGLRIYHRIPEFNITKPKKLDLMIDYSKKLSKKFCFVRIDFYYVNDSIYLSEMTFTPSNTRMKYKNFNQSKYMGSLLDINKIQMN